jgi:hypothetical protein
VLGEVHDLLDRRRQAVAAQRDVDVRGFVLVVEPRDLVVGEADVAELGREREELLPLLLHHEHRRLVDLAPAHVLREALLEAAEVVLVVQRVERVHAGEARQREPTGEREQHAP